MTGMMFVAKVDDPVRRAGAHLSSAVSRTRLVDFGDHDVVGSVPQE
jgi:hypothetical protein